ncbi:ROK family protein [Thermicanus aegyptius]|uniref:ROK family protein n=1 Tax=Thermicanus aegyptius TaxID=94009 RepID=UPI00048EF0C8|nr:ROK family protein [Thermicanus aegyptius]
MLLGGIEAGGTKFVCGIGDENGRVLERISFPTKEPGETLAHVEAFFKEKKIDALGVGSFGPVDLNPSSPTYGSITSTPKLAWRDFPLLKELKKRLSLPIGFDTDVNAAALGEREWGAGRGLDSLLYMTVGTGIGVGAVVEGKLLHGLVHPEMGHMQVRRLPEDSFPGNCPYHGDCLEGMAAGPALEKRWGKKGPELSEVDRVWEWEAYYLGAAIANLILILSPKRIILGGGVMKETRLFPMIRERTRFILNGYVASPALESIDHYIVPPGLGDNAGLCGAFALAKAAQA